MDNRPGWVPAVVIAVVLSALAVVSTWGVVELAHNNDLQTKVVKIERAGAACSQKAMLNDKRAGVCASRLTAGLIICSLNRKCREAFRLLLYRAHHEGVILGHGHSSPSGLPGGHGHGAGAPGLLDNPALDPVAPEVRQLRPLCHQSMFSVKC